MANATSRLNRRTMLDLGAKAGSIGIVAATPTLLIAAADEPVRSADPAFPALAEFRRRLDAVSTFAIVDDATDAEFDRLSERYSDARDAICEVVPATIAGAVALLRLLLEEDTLPHTDKPVVANVVRYLEGRA